MLSLAANERELGGGNPCNGLMRFSEQWRERYFSDDELKRIGSALARPSGTTPHFQDASTLYRLLDAKAGARTVPLGAPALAILDGIERTGEYVMHGPDPDKPLSRSSTALGATVVGDLGANRWRSQMRWAMAVALLISLCSGHEAATAADKITLWANRDGPHLRGANLYQRKVYPELDGPTFMGSQSFGPPVTQADFDRLSAFGANLVVISHPGLYTEQPPYQLDLAVKAHLDRLLDMALAADLFAVIALRTGPGRSEFTFMFDEVGEWFDASYLNDRVWGDPSAQAGWVAMWRATAQFYRGHRAVVGYLLMVEPNSSEVGSDALNDALDEWDAAVFHERYGGTSYDWNQIYPPISAAIREVDPDTPILIGGNGYSAVDWLNFVKPTGDERTVYIAHQYAPHEYTHQLPDARLGYPGRLDYDEDGVTEPFDRDALATLFAYFDRFTSRYGAPVAVTEFGVHRWAPGAERFLADEMELLESRGISHALWEWQGSYREFTEEVNAFNFRFGPDPASRTDVSSSGLLEVVRRYWGSNQRRPSNTPF